MADSSERDSLSDVFEWDVCEVGHSESGHAEDGVFRYFEGLSDMRALPLNLKSNIL